MGEVTEPEGSASKVFAPSIDGLGGAIARTVVVEEREDIVMSPGQGVAKVGGSLTRFIGFTVVVWRGPGEVVCPTSAP